MARILDAPHVAYCPECSVALGRDVPEGEARQNAQQHARVTGHPTNLVRSDRWTVVETLAGEPSLPLWD